MEFYVPVSARFRSKRAAPRKLNKAGSMIKAMLPRLTNYSNDISFELIVTAFLEIITENF
jgi:hypothetical protein